MLRLIEQVAPGTHDRLREMDSATTFSDLLGIARQRDYLPSRFKNRTTSDIEKYGTRLCTYYNACASYRPEPIGIPLDLFIAEESPLEGRPTSDPANRYNGWDAYTSPASIRVARVAATQHASSTASAITDALHDALQRIGPRASIKPRVEYVVDVQSGTPHRAPIVCVPGAGDGALAFVDMATAFPDSVPIRAFQARGLTYADVPHGTVESAAKAYLNALDTEHPADAIHLVGHSFGGWVAFEMACIMASRGRSPLSLTIIDATPPGQQIQEYSPDEVFDEWVRTLELAADRDFDLNSAALSEMRYADRIRAVHQKLVEFGMMPASSRWDVLRGPLRTFGAALRAGYVPTTSLPFAVNFVFADDPRESLRANLDLQNQYYREWLNWAPAGTRWRGPGNHITILDAPHVNELVRWWQSDQRRDAV
jgi:thioesterase domain-containing protein